MKKGFTLIELIIVVSLLSIIGITIGVSLNKVFKDQEQNDYNLFVEKVKSSANLYLSNDPDILNELYSNTAFKIICVQDLIDNGYLNKDTIDPKSDSNVSGNEKIKANINSDGLISIEYPIDNENEKDYLQALDVFISLGTNKTDLCYEGLNTYKLCYVNSEGKCQPISKNEIVAYIETSSGINVCNDSLIPTNTNGKYKVYYEYNNGTKKAQRNITVGDNDLPICEGGNASSWSNQGSNVTLKCSDNTTGCKSITYNNTTYNDSSIQIYMTNIDQITYEIEDEGGNTKTCEQKVMIDTTLPEIKNIVINKDSIQAQATDNLSGIAYYAFSTNSSAPNDGEWKQTNKIEKNVILEESKPASGTYYFYVKDAAGNVKRSEAINNETYNTTTAAALIQCSLSVSNGKVIVNDATNIISQASTYGFDGYNDQYETPITAQTRTYIFYVKNKSGNESTCSKTVTVTTPTYTCYKSTSILVDTVTACPAIYGRCMCVPPYLACYHDGYHCCCTDQAHGGFNGFDGGSTCLRYETSSDTKYNQKSCPSGYSITSQSCSSDYTSMIINGDSYCVKY